LGSINEDYKARDVFTPTKPARATFVEREAINAKLVDALQTPGKQIVVYGHSGSGKTTLLVNKLHQLYENHITTRCTSDMTFEKLLLNSFDQLNVFAEIERTEKHTYQFSPSIGAEYKSIKIQMAGSFSNESQVKNQRILPLQLTPQTLAKFLGEAKCCWVLEDFHKIEQSEKQKLSQVMKLFMDMADDYSDLKIIAIGAVDTARQVVEYDPEMRNRVSEIHVPLMMPSEIREIIDKGEKLLNFTLPDDAKNGIVEYSNGLASVCHQLCLNICFASGIINTLQESIRVSASELQEALQIYIANASDTLKGAFDKALRQKRVRRFDNCRLILQALSQCDQEGAVPAFLFEKIRKRHKDYPAGNLTLYLKELQTPERGALLRCDSTSNQYSFSDPFYRVFAMSVFEKENPPPPRGIIDAEVTKALERVSSQLDELKGRLELVIEQHANTPKK
jgi:energy-coupling factor transporter ATP-binding protein EcfA2